MYSIAQWKVLISEYQRPTCKAVYLQPVVLGKCRDLSSVPGSETSPSGVNKQYSNNNQSDILIYTGQTKSKHRPSRNVAKWVEHLIIVQTLTRLQLFSWARNFTLIA